MTERIIKFNVWDKQKEKMILWEKFEIYKPIPYYAVVFLEALSGSDRFIPLMWTGKEDKNKKELWEGDIIKTPYNEFYDFAYYEIIFDEKRAAFYLECIALHHKLNRFKDISRGGFCTGYLSGFARDCEKLGNKFEQPELLERKDGD